MADSTIQGLTSIEEIVDNDLMLIWDSSAVTDNTKKVTTQNLTKYIGEKSQASFTTNSNNKNVQLTLGGRNVTNGMTFDVTFLSTVIAENETDTMTITYNGVNLGNIVVGKDGVTQNMKCISLDGTYKFLQAYTTLTLKYIENVGCLVMGNPIVLSSSDTSSGYTVYADGRTESDYSPEERWTGKYWIDGKKIYGKSYHAIVNTSQLFIVDSSLTPSSCCPVIIYGSERISDGNILPLGYNGSNSVCWRVDLTHGFCRVEGYLCKEYWVTIEYTKTTD